ncbi:MULTISPECIES: hypothetical protein [unclassified Kitasatospora]|uniref:hypothetical protein n=1 Tax=unclassified Kitasatospora TaxID=2633591 RepID=UPI0007101B52|nr:MULTISPECIES: hypothetical protein [unclassified Kitasatospora]KQV11994.1 hypothetical protein ASC99_35560 [Kitasatospora sp. Root107]KRB68865.1 hypothetical protein ASE03_28600 [Kitasatospora sp. Root187]
MRAAWSAARRQGKSAERAVDFTLTVAAQNWAGARVRDVTVLPDPPTIPAGQYPNPSAWADALLQLWWKETAAAWCSRLEEALVPGAGESEEKALLLVRDWPLTNSGGEELAYLAQFPQLGPSVPDDLDTDPYHLGPRHAVVLSVPRYAAEQAVEHARYQRQRITLRSPGDDSRATESDPGPAVRDLLLTACPWLAEDPAADGPSPEASAVIRATRAVERAARGSEEQLHWSDKRRDDSLWKWRHAFRDGRWTWVPDDTDDGLAGQQLVTLLERHYDWTVMRLHVESGPAGATGVHTLFGHSGVWDIRRGVLRFRPVDGHRAVAVAQHRIIGLTGDRYRRGSGRPPLWEEYRSPQPYRSW